MLNKIFGNKILGNFSSSKLTPHRPSSENRLNRVKEGSSALQIVHLGGRVECYYMAIPAKSIIEKYPSFILTRPDIFRRPWDSIVQSEEILVPGQKYYVVPRRTVRKLRHRIKKSCGHSLLLASNQRVEDVSQGESLSTSILAKPGLKAKAKNHRVRFLGIETNKESASGSVTCDETKENGKTYMGRTAEHQMDAKRRARMENSWEPSLISIHENTVEY